MVQAVHTVQTDPVAVQGAMEAMAAAAEMVAMVPTEDQASQTCNI